MTLRFAGTLLVSAALLFCVEPMIAKMLLPLLGGAPAVWSTCMVFFQAALLAGYVYAHLSTRWLTVKTQAVVHSALILSPLLVLPVVISGDATASWPPDANPVLRLLWLLTTTVGLPFFVVSTSAPLLQTWFSHVDAEGGKDPYFLYGASNVGSMVALLGYPLLLEPLLGLTEQSQAWRGGYVVLIALVLMCAVTVFRAPARAAVSATTDDAGPAAGPLTVTRRLRWLALAFIPSSLLLGVTTFISTDVAAIPLFWVVPLAVYLATFIFVFAKKRRPPHALMVRILPLLTTLTVGMMLSDLHNPAWLFILVHLSTFFVASMVCHGELANDRPHAAHLTEFYLCMSAGGVLGGIFNGLIGPAILDRLLEYPLALVLACMARRVNDERSTDSEQRGDLIVPAVIGALTVGLNFLVQKAGLVAGLQFGAIFALPLMANFRTLLRPTRFALGIGAILLASSLHTNGQLLHRERNFFGVLRVVAADGYVNVVDGTTVHGRQSTDPARRHDPVGYYDRSGPLGKVFEQFRSGSSGSTNPHVGVIGLGSGEMAAYARPGETWTFYEINPAMVRTAKNPNFFTYLADFPDPNAYSIVLGDARLRLREAPEKGYGILILDAFSSDAIPQHLITREALRLYLTKLDDHGILALHISNNHLDLRPVLSDLAKDAGLVAYVGVNSIITEEEANKGKLASAWFVMARRDEDVPVLTREGSGYVRREGDPARRVWTDDFSNLLGAMRWW